MFVCGGNDDEFKTQNYLDNAKGIYCDKAVINYAQYNRKRTDTGFDMDVSVLGNSCPAAAVATVQQREREFEA